MKPLLALFLTALTISVNSQHTQLERALQSNLNDEETINSVIKNLSQNDSIDIMITWLSAKEESYQQNKDLDDQVRSLIGLTYLYFEQECPKNAALHLEKARSLAPMVSISVYTSVLSKLYYKLGVEYRSGQRFSQAIEWFQKGLVLAIDMQMNKIYLSRINKELARTYLNLGRLLKDESYLTEGLKYALVADDLMSTDNLHPHKLQTTNTIGVIYQDLDLDSLALLQYKKLYGLAKYFGEEEGELISLNNMGFILIKQKKYEEGLKSLQKAKNTNIAHSVKIYVTIGLGQAYLGLQQYDSAIFYLNKGIQEAKATEYYTNFDARLRGLTALHETYSRKGDHIMAYNALAAFKTYSDSLLQSNQKKQLVRYESQLQFQQELDSVNFAQYHERVSYESKISEQRTNQLISIILVSLLIILLYISYRYYRSKQKSNTRLIALNAEISQQKADLTKLNDAKSRFFSIIGHDIRGPMSGVMGFHELLKMHLKDHYKQDDLELEGISNQLTNACNQLLNLLDNLLAWAMKEQGLMPNTPEIISIRSCIEENNQILAPKAISKHIELLSEVESDVNIVADKNSLMTILRNLTSNALKFTKDQGSVKLTAGKENGIAFIKVIDNGIGISKEKLKTLFKMDSEKTTKGTSGEKGFGLGLNMVHDFVKMNKGSIRVDSTPNEGSVFTLEFPEA